jgi:hypothetical protein
VKNYIGCKIVAAEPMTAGEFEKKFNKKVSDEEQLGYLVVYPPIGDSAGLYTSWCPKSVFEKCNREVDAAEEELMGDVEKGYTWKD